MASYTPAGWSGPEVPPHYWAKVMAKTAQERANTPENKMQAVIVRVTPEGKVKRKQMGVVAVGEAEAEAEVGTSSLHPEIPNSGHSTLGSWSYLAAMMWEPLAKCPAKGMLEMGLDQGVGAAQVSRPGWSSQILPPMPEQSAAHHCQW
jgi:hypothetical protein